MLVHIKYIIFLFCLCNLPNFGVSNCLCNSNQARGYFLNMIVTMTKTIRMAMTMTMTMILTIQHFIFNTTYTIICNICMKTIIEAYLGIVDRIIALIFETDTTNVIQTFPIYKIAVRIHRISFSVHNVEPFMI